MIPTLTAKETGSKKSTCPNHPEPKISTSTLSVSLPPFPIRSQPTLHMNSGHHSQSLLRLCFISYYLDAFSSSSSAESLPFVFIDVSIVSLVKTNNKHPSLCLYDHAPINDRDTLWGMCHWVILLFLCKPHREHSHNLHGLAYYTPGLYEIAHCSWEQVLYKTAWD